MTTPQDPRHRPGDQDHRLHDVDLVAAYAGEDPGIDRDAAAALVAACPDCRSEFSLQRDVAMWLSGAPVVTLDEGERSFLHDRVERGIAGSDVVSLSDRRSRRLRGRRHYCCSRGNHDDRHPFGGRRFVAAGDVARRRR